MTAKKKDIESEIDLIQQLKNRSLAMKKILLKLNNDQEKLKNKNNKNNRDEK